MAYDDPRLYDLRTAGFTDDVRFFVREAARTTGPVLELAVGTARLAAPVARTGRRVVGVDLDAAMLRRARRRTRGLAVSLVRGDVTRLPLEGPFPLVFCGFASLHDLPDLEAWSRCFESVRRILAPDGTFLLDDRPPPAPGTRVRRLRDPERGKAVTTRHVVEVDRASRTVRGETVYEVEGEPPRRFPFRGSFAEPGEIRGMLEEAGLRVVEVLGSHRGEPREADSPRTIVRAERA